MKLSPRELALAGSAVVLAVLAGTGALVWGEPAPERTARAAEPSPVGGRPAERPGFGDTRLHADGRRLSLHPAAVLDRRGDPMPLARDLAGVVGGVERAGVAAELDPKTQKKVDKLDAKLAKKQEQHEALEADVEETTLARAAALVALALAESLLADAEQALADAYAMPKSTAQEIAARNLAIKAAKQALKQAKKDFKSAKKSLAKADKKLAKLDKKLAKNEAKQAKLVAKLEALDPGHFGGPSDDDGDDDDDEPAVAGPSPYDPPWADVEPLQVIILDHDPELSDTQNGSALKSAVSALQAGDMLVVGAGTWSVPSKFSPFFAGTAQVPVWVVAAEGAAPVITRPDASQNVLNPSGSYGVLRGFEITGGSAGIRLGASSNLWLDQLHIHDTPEAALTANTADTDHLYITRNHIHHISVGGSGTGEGMYLGANHGAHVMRQSIVALNHVHDTAGSQGDGIEVKQGSWGNWIVENDVHDTKFPCLTIYGTDGEAPNLVERNTLARSDTQVLQVQGEAIVRNNLLFGGSPAFQSHDHQGDTRDLVFVHNTILSSAKGAHLADWGGRAGMVFANNVVYSSAAQSVTFGSGSAGVQWGGNVLRGGTSGAPGGSQAGNGLGDFVDASWDGAGGSDVTPASGSPILGAASPAWGVPEDLHGDERSGDLEAGCIDVE